MERCRNNQQETRRIQEADKRELQGAEEGEGEEGVDEMRSSTAGARAGGQKVRGHEHKWRAGKQERDPAIVGEAQTQIPTRVFVRSEFAQPTGGCVGGALFV